MSERTLVIGAGVAGAAAALGAAARGEAVEVVSRGSGASALTSGALDWSSWATGARGPVPALRPDLAGAFEALLVELGFVLGPCTLVTGAGVVRSAAGADRCLLDLDRHAPERPLGVVHSNWLLDQGPALLAALRSEPRARGRTFVAVHADRLFPEAKRDWSLGALAQSFSTEEAVRLTAVAEAAHAEGVAALLVGPYLGLDPAVHALLERAPLPIKEHLSPPDGSSGQRLERRLEEALTRRGISLMRERAIGVNAVPNGVTVTLEHGGARRALECARVIVATGGLVGGGLTLGNGPGQGIGSPLFANLSDSGSQHGWDATTDRGSWLRPGLGPGLPQKLCGGRVVAVGDVRAGAEQTLLAALRDGLSVDWQ